MAYPFVKIGRKGTMKIAQASVDSLSKRLILFFDPGQNRPPIKDIR